MQNAIQDNPRKVQTKTQHYGSFRIHVPPMAFNDCEVDQQHLELSSCLKRTHQMNPSNVVAAAACPQVSSQWKLVNDHWWWCQQVMAHLQDQLRLTQKKATLPPLMPATASTCCCTQRNPGFFSSFSSIVDKQKREEPYLFQCKNKTQINGSKKHQKISGLVWKM